MIELYHITEAEEAYLILLKGFLCGFVTVTLRLSETQNEFKMETFAHPGGTVTIVKRTLLFIGNLVDIKALKSLRKQLKIKGFT